VKIRNGGKHAYKPELFGNYIAIERRITIEGQTSYRIQSDRGVTIGHKREELEDILDHIQLQVDNPMTILTQDTARQFLGNSTAEDKYKLFMKGVQLSQLDADYNIVEEQISALSNTLETKEVALTELKALDDDWRTKVRLFERSAEIDNNVKQLTGQFVWSQVQEKEEVHEHWSVS